MFVNLNLKISVYLCILIFTFTGCGTLGKSDNQIQKDSILQNKKTPTTESLTPPPSSQKKELIRIAVLPLNNKWKQKISVDEVNVLTDAIKIMMSYLPKSEYLVMTKESMQVLIDPSKGGLQDCIGKCEVETGRLLNASWIVTGELVRFGDQLRVMLKIHNTKSGQFAGGDSFQGKDATALLSPLKQKTIKLMKAISPEFIRQLNNQAGPRLSDQVALLEETEGEFLDQPPRRALTSSNPLFAERRLKIKSSSKSKSAQKLSFDEQIAIMKQKTVEKEAHKRRVDQRWHSIRNSRGSSKERLQSLNLFLKEYQRHPLGNPREEEALQFGKNLEDLIQKEQKDLLKKKHERQVRLKWDQVKPLVRSGDESAKEALTLFLSEYEDHPLGNPLKAEAKKLLDQINSRNRKRIAVLQFKNSAKLSSFEIAFLTDTVRGVASKFSGFKVMTKENITIMLPEYDEADYMAESEVKTGRQLGAHFIVTGEVGRINGQLLLSIRLFNTDEGDLLSQEMMYGSSVREMQNQLKKTSNELFGRFADHPFGNPLKDEAEKVLNQINSRDQKSTIKENTPILDRRLCKTICRIAVLDFKNSANLGHFEMTVLTDGLRGTAPKLSWLRLITKENMVYLLPPEHTFDEDEVRTGKMLGADFIITGEVGRIEDQFMLSIRLFNTENGSLLAQEVVSGSSVQQILGQLKEVTNKLMGL